MSPETPSSAPTIVIDDRPGSSVSTIPPADDTVTTPLSPTTAGFKRDLPKRIWRWLRGPVPPQDATFTPLFPGFQRLPPQLLRRGPLKQRKWRAGLLLLFWFLWLTAFITVVHNSRFRSQVGGVDPYILSCSASLWYLVLCIWILWCIGWADMYLH